MVGRLLAWFRGAVAMVVRFRLPLSCAAAFALGMAVYHFGMRDEPSSPHPDELVAWLRRDHQHYHVNLAPVPLTKQYEHTVAELCKIIDDDNPRRISQRCTAAEVLAHYRATSAMPALVRNLKMETLFKSTKLKWFYMEHYPCAQAIVDMGPSALEPFLFELRGPNNNEPLMQLTPHAWERKFTGFDAELAARITFALCGNDFELARKKITEVEKLAPSRTFFVQMRYHLDHTVNKPPWQFRRRPPTA